MKKENKLIEFISTQLQTRVTKNIFENTQPTML